VDQQARDPLLEAHLAAWRIPDAAKIRRQRFERVSIDVHESRCHVPLRRQSVFELGDPCERAIPARFQFRGHQTVVGVDSFIASGGQRRFDSGPAPAPARARGLIVVVLLGEVARSIAAASALPCATARISALNRLVRPSAPKPMQRGAASARLACRIRSARSPVGHT